MATWHWIAVAALVLAAAIAVPLMRKRRECPACSRRVPVGAIVCPKCGADIGKLDSRSSRSQLKGGGKGW